MKTPLGSDFESRNETSEIAAGVDQSITAEDVVEQSGLYGGEATPSWSQPHTSGTTTSGGGAVSFERFGVKLTPGATSGDVARFETINLGGVSNLSKTIKTILFHPSTGTPFTDYCHVGMGNRSGPNAGKPKTVLDLNNAQYRVHDGTNEQTASATLPAGGDRVYLTIVQDYQNGETTFRQQGAVDEEVTISKVENPRAGDVVMESAGSGDQVREYYTRTVVLP